jgi:hypothetical protein
MKVKDRIKKLKQDNFNIIHKIYPEGVKMEEFDWIRIYKSKSHGSIDEMIHSLEVKEIDSIPNEILELEFDKEDSWIVGGFLSLDLVLSI